MCGTDVFIINCNYYTHPLPEHFLFPCSVPMQLILTMKAECYPTTLEDSSHLARREANLDLARAQGNRPNCGRPID